MSTRNNFLKFGPVSLIDILVVLTLVGGVLVIVLAVINPLEIIRQKQDVVTSQSLNTLTSALKDYRLKFQKLPWEETKNEDSPTPVSKKPLPTWLEELVNKGFIDSELRFQTNLKEYLVINSEVSKICFYPASVKYRVLGGYDENGVNECLPGGFTPCYVCEEY